MGLIRSGARLLCGLGAAAIVIVGCSSAGGGAGGTAGAPSRVTCPVGIAAASTPAGQSSGGEPDFALYGFPRVAATEQFTPGQELQIRTDRITLTIPPDFYTDPLRFELLVSDQEVWQRCAPETLTVLAPYAFRITDPATGERIGRIDKPVAATITDPRIGPQARFWTTSPENPPVAEQANPQPRVEGTSIHPNNGTPRIGWFATVPKA